MRTFRTLEPLGGACLLSIGMEMDAYRGWAPAFQQEWTLAAQRYLDRARRILAG